MDTINTLDEAKSWFLLHADGSVIVIRHDGTKKECSNYQEAEDFLFS